MTPCEWTPLAQPVPFPFPFPSLAELRNGIKRLVERRGVGGGGGALGVGVSDNLAASGVGMLVAFEEFQQDDLLSLVVDVVQDPVGADTQSVLRREV